MRFFSILLLQFIFPIIAASQNGGVFNFKKDMVWVENAKLFVCKYEVTNVEYREFTNELLSDSSNISKDLIYNLYYPDTTVWIRQFKHQMGDPMNAYYRWLPAFNAYPVVGITYEGAIKYCEWLTKKYGNGKYKFRLPTKKEFIKYAKVNQFSISGGIENPRNDERKYLVNYKPNRINLDDSLSKVFYNPKNNTFLRIYDDTTTKEIDERWVSSLKSYNHYVENYLNGFLYIGVYRDFLKLKIQDSITYYNAQANTYTKEKLILNTYPNYYDDGYLYTSPTRGIKTNDDLSAFDKNGKIRSDYKPALIPNKSSYPADKNGLFDLAGNVSEMVSEKGTSMGGNWNSTITELNYDSEFKYEETDVLIGFRIVAELLSE